MRLSARGPSSAQSWHRCVKQQWFGSLKSIRQYTSLWEGGGNDDIDLKITGSLCWKPLGAA